MVSTLPSTQAAPKQTASEQAAPSQQIRGEQRVRFYGLSWHYTY